MPECPVETLEKALEEQKPSKLCLEDGVISSISLGMVPGGHIAADHKAVCFSGERLSPNACDKERMPC